jgi:hypothetical protein
MSFFLSTPDELAEEPESAPLEILRSATDVSRRALLAAHPELAEDHLLDEDPEVTPRQCLAANVLSALHTLAEAIRRYQAHLDNLAARHSPKRDDDGIPF